MFELGDFSEVAPHGKFKAFLDFFSFLLYVAIISCKWSINMFFKELNLKFILDIKNSIMPQNLPQISFL